MKKDSSFFLVVDKTPLDKVEEIQGSFSSLRKFMQKTRIYISSLAQVVISSTPFEYISIVVIIANSLSLAVEDPTAETQSY